MVTGVQAIVADVKRKRELSGLADEVVVRSVERTLRSFPKLRAQLDRPFSEFSRRKDYKEFRSTVRGKLREIYGVFELDKKGERPGLVRAGQDKALLTLHQSSKERLAWYPRVYEEIFARTGKPESILDLGCGANPYSYAFLGCTPRYIAVDLPSRELELLGSYFRQRGINGRVLGIDLSSSDAAGRVRELGEVDVCFCFKLLDSLESAVRQSSKRLLRAVRARWLVVSFPTLSLGGGRAIRRERRAWFENFLSRQGWSYERFSIPNEIFYVIRTSSLPTAGPQ